MNYESDEAYHDAMQAQAEQEAAAESESMYHDWRESMIKSFTENGSFEHYAQFIIEQDILPLIKDPADRARVLEHIKPKPEISQRLSDEEILQLPF